MNYSDYFFVISKDNWKKVKDHFYGYKTLENEGVWLDIKNNSDSVVIQSCNLSPFMVKYENKDTGYWAISNSIEYLAEYLTKNEIEISYNGYSAITEGLTAKTVKYFTYAISPTKTQYDEIEVIPFFKTITIKGDSLNIDYLDPKEVFTVDLKSKEAYLLIKEWFEDWSTYIKSLGNKVSGTLSSGTDSRFLLRFLLDTDYSYILHSPEGEKEDLIVNKIEDKYNFKCISEVNESAESKYSLEEIKQLRKYFFKGNYSTSIYHEVPTFNELSYKLKGNLPWGVKTVDVLQSKYLNDFFFYDRMARRMFRQKYLYQYYVHNNAIITPYCDLRILKLLREPNTFYEIELILYKLFFSSILEIPVRGHVFEKMSYIKYGDRQSIKFDTLQNVCSKEEWDRTEEIVNYYKSLPEYIDYDLK